MCGSSARTDLYGGRSAMTVPTVTGTGTPSFLEMRVKISDLCCPCDTQSVQDELISKTQHTGV